MIGSKKIRFDIDADVIANAIIRQNSGSRFFNLDNRGEVRLHIDMVEQQTLRFRIEDKGRLTDCALDVSEIFAMRARINSLLDTIAKMKRGEA